MKRIFIKLIVFLPILFLFNNDIVRAQPASIIWIRVADDSSVADSQMLWLVNTPTGSWMKDSINEVFQEIENPPGAPGFGAAWVPWANYVNGPLGFEGNNFTPMCIQGVPAAGQRDTFVISCTNTDAGVENFILKWPHTGYLAARCDSIFLQDKTNLLTIDGTTPIGKINMFIQDSLFIFQPLQTVSTTFKLTIYIYGVHLVDSLYVPPPIIETVHESPRTIPTSFRLEQNYPNPFNPTTQFAFSIPKRGFVTLTVYDVLGRTVATLVEEEKNPGRYVVPWNADNIGSGVYFYTLLSGIEHDVKKLIILR